ncbi:hypothetical protein CORC01_09075 [Colletotrichum orchidophilum]|uniref:Uncharacterized protein n=1 Tax=Colletotrichum orchidophilum TaxID=1209926 RepID=A0A1G4B2S9_9PEZI|nr:uncharacterized protein CORC01_09075 [Colletotrichum orchidophilum]OHE95643.1 hypothetical protein CORC01_09075 [Colletotrichum orchidophilum]
MAEPESLFSDKLDASSPFPAHPSSPGSFLTLCYGRQLVEHFSLSFENTRRDDNIDGQDVGTRLDCFLGRQHQHHRVVPPHLVVLPLRPL